MRLVPGTRALRTLLAAGKHLNFTRAADELGLTPAAVSFQIKEIEDQLGVKLFTRTSRTIRLTEPGTILCDAAADALDVMHRAVSKAQKASRGTAQLKVTVDPQFATKWLMRRVERFRKIRQRDGVARHGGIDGVGGGSENDGVAVVEIIDPRRCHPHAPVRPGNALA